MMRSVLLFLLTPGLSLLASTEEALLHGSPLQRIEAARYMGASRSPVHIRSIETGLRDSLAKDTVAQDAPLMTEMVLALGKIGHPSALPVLYDVLQHSTGSKGKGPAVTTPPQRLMSIDGIVMSARNPGPSIKQNSVPVARPTPGRLDRPYSFPQSPDANWSVAEEFRSEAFNPNDETHIVRQMNINQTSLTIATVSSIAEIKDPQAASRIIFLLDSPSPDIRAAAVRALSTIKDSKSKAFLQRLMLKEDDTAVQVALAGGLLRYNRGDTDSLKILSSFLYAKELSIRIAAAKTFLDLLIDHPLLRTALRTEPHPTVRRILSLAVERINLQAH